MLAKFSVENYKSIGRKQTLNFVATADSSHKETLLTKPNTNFEVLPVMAIYGGNGAGKSNIFMALRNAISIIKNSLKTQEVEPMPYSPFLLDDTLNLKSTKLEFLFSFKDIKYFYGFSYNKEEINEEYLYSYPRGKQVKIFERERNSFSFKKDQNELKILSTRTVRNRLFISTAAEWNYEEIKEPFNYLCTFFIFNDSCSDNPNKKSWEDFTFKQIQKNEIFKQRILKILNEIQSDITDFDVNIQKILLTEKNLPKGIPEEIKKIFINKTGEIPSVMTTHIGKDINNKDKMVFFSYIFESAGTRKFIELIGPILDILDKGKFLFIDELENSLHAFIVKAIIKLFMSPKTNTNNAQLIFNTHNINLLDLKIFRRDQIWLCEKDQNKSSTFYSLSDLKGIRKDDNISKGYLRGKYGGIPFDPVKMNDFLD